MNSVEEIKKKRLLQLIREQQGQITDEHHTQMEVAQQIHALENLVKQYLTKEAYQRYTNLKISHTEKAIQLLSIIGQLIQAGQIKEKIDDAKLKGIIIRITPKKQEMKIRRI